MAEAAKLRLEQKSSQVAALQERVQRLIAATSDGSTPPVKVSVAPQAGAFAPFLPSASSAAAAASPSLSGTATERLRLKWAEPSSAGQGSSDDDLWDVREAPGPAQALTSNSRHS